MRTPPELWTESEVEEFCENAQPDELVTVLRALAARGTEQSVSVLVLFLGARFPDTFSKPMPSQLAARTLISSGTRGIEVLRGQLLSPEGNIRYASTVLRMLWDVSRNRPLTGGLAMSARVPEEFMNFAISDDMAQAARRLFQDLFAEARVNSWAFWKVGGFFHDLSSDADLEGSSGDDATALMDLFAEGAIKLTRSVIDEFSDLIAQELPEELYQDFLAKYPVLLDPLGADVIPKQRLGLEYASDFALRSHDGRWTLVEIERPHDSIFTLGFDFRERFVHGFGQVLDFQNWVDQNVSYAQTLMTNVVAPRGLLVMGLRSRLSPRESRKLHQFVENSRRIDFLTFDDLLARACTLYENLRKAGQS